MNDRGYLEFCDIRERNRHDLVIGADCLSLSAEMKVGGLISSLVLGYTIWSESWDVVTSKQLDVFSLDTISLGHLTSHCMQLCMCHQYVYIVDCWNYWHYIPTAVGARGLSPPPHWTTKIRFLVLQLIICFGELQWISFQAFRQHQHVSCKFIYYEFEQVNFLLKDECPVDALRACVSIYLPYILKNNVKFRRK